MKYQEFVEKFKKQVFALSSDKQLNLAIRICNKLYPDYQNFFNIHQWGDPKLLMDAIKLCEQAQITNPDKKEIQVMQSKVEDATPHMDDFGDEYGSFALNACIAVFYTLQFILDNEPINTYHVGTALTDTVDFKVQENEELSEDQIDEHPMMQEARMFLLEQTN